METLHSIAQHSMESHSMAGHSTAQHTMAATTAQLAQVVITSQTVCLAADAAELPNRDYSWLPTREAQYGQHGVCGPCKIIGPST